MRHWLTSDIELRHIGARGGINGQIRNGGDHVLIAPTSKLGLFIIARQKTPEKRMECMLELMIAITAGQATRRQSDGLKQIFVLPLTDGFLVEAVEPDSPAGIAGIVGATCR